MANDFNIKVSRHNLHCVATGGFILSIMHVYIYIFLLCQTEKPSSRAVDVLQLKFIILCSCSQTYLFDCFEDIGTYTDFGNG